MVKKRTKEILAILDENLGTEIGVTLDAENPGQLLISTILSAQCTDARVNMVTPGLFRKYPDMHAFAQADQKELEQDIHSIGFYHSKAKNIIGCAKKICEDFGGEVPSSLEELTSLPGVGRKTANVIRGHVFGQPSIVVDTHVKRISKRLGLTKETDPAKVEQDLMKELPEDHWILINLQLITFGREICHAQRPDCRNCYLTGYCAEYKKNK